MFNKYIVLTTILFLINNILVWYQLMSLMGIPISLLFWLCTKWGYIGFGNLWSVRFMGFAMSMITFPIMTYFYLGETVTMKTGITILLSIIIMLLQLI